MAETVVGALAFAATAGVATFFAPCAFPLLPGYVGYYVHENDQETSMVLPAGAAAGGALAALAVVAAVVLIVGQPVKAALPTLEPVIGIGLVALGVAILLGRSPELRIALPERPSSVVGFGVFGAAYAVAAAGCVVPLFVGVLTQALGFGIGPAALVLGVYALAVAAPLVGVTLLAGAGVDEWQRLGRHSGAIQTVAAVTMVLAGVWQLYVAIFRFGAI
ncbi:cytochrome C biogenesis protein transmembrane region/thiol-disulfide transporter [Salinarchaeum sp. Harcht-Bsk1]|uniref:cytochrome c biogenesis protein CcdA n=1 Tax=Salinarchaeum sp. Harcht-Bsk1 TaxID=1333523 RepID=UPI00034247ED|nr:cytochrome c biogenesis protein CcdA [Salinarchaeum sp. Harcht-Bsk1]AGN01642.1 cytochrome C biogenesis protein transmembrane region/thiol-disulfide transporter [Salinarchaeum sp. Harcht-Bsk1]